MISKHLKTLFKLISIFHTNNFFDTFSASSKRILNLIKLSILCNLESPGLLPSTSNNWKWKIIFVKSSFIALYLFLHKTSYQKPKLCYNGEHVALYYTGLILRSSLTFEEKLIYHDILPLWVISGIPFWTQGNSDFILVQPRKKSIFHATWFSIACYFTEMSSIDSNFWNTQKM